MPQRATYLLMLLALLHVAKVSFKVRVDEKASVCSPVTYRAFRSRSGLKKNLSSISLSPLHVHFRGAVILCLIMN